MRATTSCPTASPTRRPKATRSGSRPRPRPGPYGSIPSETAPSGKPPRSREFTSGWRGRAGAGGEPATLAGVPLRLAGRAGEEGKLFGSITAQDIADELGRQGHPVDRRRIELDHPIKTLGEHTVSLRLHPDVHAEVRVSVVAE